MHIAHHPGQLELGLQKIVLVLSLQEKVVPIWQDREITEQDCKSERVKVSGSKSSGNNSFRDQIIVLELSLAATERNGGESY